MSYDFTAVTSAFSDLATALKQPVIDIALAVVAVVVVVFLIRYGVAWLRRIGSR